MNRWWILVLGLAATFPLPVRGQAMEGRVEGSGTLVGVLTLSEARRRALGNNPGFLADLEDVAVSESHLGTTASYPFNPELEGEYPDGLAGGRGAEWRLQQTFNLGGQWGIRKAAARLEVGGAQARGSNEARILVRDVERAFVEALASQERLALAGEILATNEQLLSTVRTRLSEGEVSRLEANLTGMEAQRAKTRILHAQRSWLEARAALAGLLGLSPDDVLAVADSVDLPLGAGAETADRPDVKAMRFAADAARERERLASRGIIPDLTVAGLATKEAGEDRSRFGISLGVSLPLFQRVSRDEAAAHARQARYRADAVSQAAANQVRMARGVHHIALQEFELFRDELQDPVRENRELLDVAYSEGKLDLPALLLLRNQLLDIELGYWDAWERERLAAADLRSALGINLADVSEGLPEVLR